MSFSFVATWSACRCPGFVELGDAVGPPWTSYLLAVGFDFCDGGEKVLDPSVRLRWGLGDCKTCHLGLSREVIRKRTELNPVRFSQSIVERLVQCSCWDSQVWREEVVEDCAEVHGVKDEVVAIVGLNSNQFQKSS